MYGIFPLPVLVFPIAILTPVHKILTVCIFLFNNTAFKYNYIRVIAFKVRFSYFLIWQQTACNSLPETIKQFD